MLFLRRALFRPLRMGGSALLFASFALGCNDDATPQRDASPDAASAFDAGDATTAADGALDANDAGVSTDGALPPVIVDPSAPRTLWLRSPQEVCLLDQRGAVACRGPHSALEVVQPGPFVAYTLNSAGLGCGRDAQGLVRCWGGSLGSGALCESSDPSCTQSGLPPPEQSFRDIALGLHHGCGITTAGSLLCWGKPGSDMLTTPPSGSDFVELKSGDEVSCARTQSGTVKCWGNVFGFFGSIEDAQHIEMGEQSVCALLRDGSLDCLRWDSSALPTPGTSIGQYSMSTRALCMLTRDGAAQCHGDGAQISRITPLPGPFLQIANTDDYACGLRSDGNVQCWGADWGNGAGLESCRVNEAKLSVNGTMRSFMDISPWSSLQAPSTPNDAFRYFTSFDNQRYALVAGEAAPNELGITARLASSGSVSLRTSYWLLDSSDAQPGAVTCSGKDSTVRVRGDELLFDLNQTAALSCPGQGVSGSLSFCVGGSCTSQSATGSLQGKPWSAVAKTYGYQISGRGQLTFEDGSLLLMSQEASASGANATLRWGLLFTAPDGPFQGQVFCVASGSSIRTDTFQGQWQLSAFSLLASCPANATGTLSGCIR